MTRIFLWKKIWISKKNIFYEWLTKNKNKHFVEKSFSLFEGAPFKHFEHTMTFFCKMFLIFF